MNPAKIRGSVCLFLSFLMLLVVACSDDDPATPAPGTGSGVVTITVDETSTWPGGQLGYVFTSSLDGAVLDYAIWTGPAVLELEIPTSLGERFHVTQVNDYPGFEKYLKTTDHMVAEENSLDLTRDTYLPDVEFAELQLSNIPAHNNYYLTSGDYGIQGISLPATLQAKMRYGPADLLLMIGGSASPRSYLWVTDVGFGSQHQVDLSNLAPMDQHTISLPGSQNQIRGKVKGIINASGGLPRRVYPLDEEIFSVPTQATWQVDYLEAGFDGYQTTFSQNLDVDPLKYVSFWTEGGFPGSVDFWDLDITVMDDGIEGCLVQTSGDVGQLELYWEQRGADPIFWDIGVPDPSQPVVLPLLPDSLAPLVPGLDREEFVLRSVTARKSSEVANDEGTPIVKNYSVLQNR